MLKAHFGTLTPYFNHRAIQQEICMTHFLLKTLVIVYKFHPIIKRKLKKFIHLVDLVRKGMNMIGKKQKQEKIC
jgi:hypothetical protein